jgi:hypothetical protein
MTVPASWLTSGQPVSADLARRPGSMSDAELAELVGAVKFEAEAGLTCVAWAEESIIAAIELHPSAENDLFHAFTLLVPSLRSQAWSQEFIFKGHARELLERVAKGDDTTLGTAAECAIAMSAVSKVVPLHGPATGFYLRVWAKAFPDKRLWPEGETHSEGLYRDQIDEHERYVRAKLRQPSRRVDPVAITCDGAHWGQPVTCKYALSGIAPEARGALW